MSRLYASIESDKAKTQATRGGREHLTTHTRGWDTGVEVHAYVGDNGEDTFEVYLTRGSLNATDKILVATYTEADVRQHKAHTQVR